ncbi:MAG: hypothetical protein ACLRMZ_22340 [Blautia marasmi]
MKELKAKVQKQYEDAQTADPALAAFLDGLGEDVTGSAETADGTTLVVTGLPMSVQQPAVMQK